MSDKARDSYVLPAVLIIVLLLPHVLFLGNGYVDVELYVVDAASEVARYGFNANLTDYFYTVFNPIFSVLLLGGSYTIFGESEIVSRLTISALSVGFTLFLYFYLRRRTGTSISFVAPLLVISNPMFIVYSQYVGSDVPFFILTSVALLMILYASTPRRETIVSSVMLGISLATKYVTAVVFPVVLIYSSIKLELFPHFSRDKLLALVRFNLWYFGLTLAVSLPFILVALKYQTGIVPPEVKSLHTVGVAMFIPRFTSSLLWLGLFIGPSCLIFFLDLWDKTGKKKFLAILSILAVLTLIISYFFPISSLHIQDGTFGEMNLGWVESVVPSPILSSAFFFVILVGELFVANLVFDLKYSENEGRRKLIYWIVVPIVVMSFTRVANRYMLVILVPLSLYLADIINKMYAEHRKSFILAVLVLHVLIFISVGFYSNYYLQLRGQG
ncbi:MAG: glycosyltransferase family 39 protein [Dehalococcoidales bacterium]|jgi:hypothetical protein|nr:glycosyltransferase family 39 protein [Dehalococcoidales bacterium]